MPPPPCPPRRVPDRVAAFEREAMVEAIRAAGGDASIAMGGWAAAKDLSTTRCSGTAST